LSGLDREQLRELLMHLAANDAYIADEIERQIALTQVTPDKGGTDEASVDAPSP
jgi:hypothetical protein